MSELKRCPFCGGEARVNIFLGNYCVTCENCMGAIFPARGMTEEEAIKAWNTRKPIERIVERLEILYDEAQDKLSDDFIYYDGWGDGVDMAMRAVKEEGGLND